MSLPCPVCHHHADIQLINGRQNVITYGSKNASSQQKQMNVSLTPSRKNTNHKRYAYSPAQRRLDFVPKYTRIVEPSFTLTPGFGA